MPSKRKSVFKIVAGHQVKATVDAATAIKSFPVQTDQSLAYPWTAPSTFLSRIPTVRVVRFASGISKPHGGYSYSWGFNYWTVLMWNYFRSQYLTTEDTSALVTTLQYDENDVAIYMQSTLHYPRFGEGLNPQAGTIGGYQVRLDFTNGVEIT